VWRLPPVGDCDRAACTASSSTASRRPVRRAVRPRTKATSSACPRRARDAAPGAAAASATGFERSTRDEDKSPRGELWRWIAGACLAALVLESLWAAWIGPAEGLGMKPFALASRSPADRHARDACKLADLPAPGWSCS
jgi:hypothetical protein